MDDEVTKAKAQKKTDALFVLACAQGYLGDVRVLLEQGARLKALDKRGVSGLHYACGQGRTEVVPFLWSKGVELDNEDPSGNLALHYAVSYGRAQVVDVLLQKGAWVEGSNAADDTVLHIAARKGYTEIVRSLLEHGAKATLKEVNKRGLTAFGEAVVEGHLDSARLLLKAGSKLQVRCRHWTLLRLCVGQDKQASTQFLLESGADADAAGSLDGETALHFAAKKRNTELVKLLLHYKADASLLDSSSRRPQDLVDPNSELYRMLRTSKPSSGVTQSRTALKSELDLFKEASEEKQLEKVRHLAAMKDSQQAKQIAEFPLEFGNQLRELKRLQEVLTIQKVCVDVLEDEDFQQQCSTPEALQAVKDMQQDPQALRRYASARPNMVNFLTILQKFQMVVAANGNHPVPFESLLRSCEEGYYEKSKMRLQGMELMVKLRMRAAKAAALAENEADAKRAAECAMDPKSQPSSAQQNVGQDGSSSAAPEIQPDGASRSGRAKRPEFVQPEELDEYGLPRLPPAEPFSWQRFRNELWTALIKTTLIFAVFLMMSYFLLGRLPWQIEPPEEVVQALQGNNRVVNLEL